MSASQPGLFSLQQFTDAGALLVGGRLYTYTYGTTTQKTAYTDAAGVVPHTYTSDGVGGQYIALNARGELPAPLYLTTGSYDIALKRADGSTVWTRRADPTDAGQLLTASLASTAGPAQIGLDAIVYPTGTVGAGMFTTVFGDGATDKAAKLTAANALGQPIRIVGVAVVASPVTITVPIVDTISQIFSSASQVTINNGLPVRPEWWGLGAGAIPKAIAALPSAGGVVQLRPVVYAACNYAYNGAFMDRDNIVIRGAQMPQLASDCRSLVNGTVIRGSFIAYANNVTIENLGIDCGVTYLGASAAQDAMFCSYGSDALRTAGTLKKGLRLHNVIGLNKTPSDLTHSMLVGEGYTDVTLTGDIVGCYGVHSVVIKARQVKGSAALSGYLNDSESIIIKTDSHTSDASIDVSIGDVNVLQDGPDGWAPYLTSASSTSIGFFIHAFAGNVSKIRTGKVNERGHAYGMKWQMDGSYVIDNVQMAGITTDTNSVCGVDIETLVAGATYQRCGLGDVVTRNAPIGGVFVWQNESSVKVNSFCAVNCTTAAVSIGGIADPIIDTIVAENCGAIFQMTGTKMPRVGAVVYKGTTAATYTASGSGQVPALATGWNPVGGGENFNVVPGNYGMNLKGLVTPSGGGPTNLVTTLPAFARPTQTLNRLAGARTGATEAAVMVTVQSNGQVFVNPASASIANVSAYLSLDIDYEVLP